MTSLHRRAAAAAVLAVIAACSAPPTPTPTVAPLPHIEAPAWQVVDPGPLEPRRFAMAFWTGDEVLVLGGDAAEPACPFEVDCIPAPLDLRADGAAYNPATDTWRPLSAAPVPLWQMAGAVLDGTLYLRVFLEEPVDGLTVRFLAYDIAGDRWEELLLPPGNPGVQLVAAGDVLVGIRPTQEAVIEPDVVYDPARGVWDELPIDPIAPAYDRAAVWTGAEVVLLGIPIDPRRPGNQPPVYGAAAIGLADQEWRRLPDAQGVTGWDPTWFWSDGVIVNPALGSANGGQVNGWGREVAFGGQLVAPAGEWRPLPAVPGGAAGPLFEGQAAAGSAWVLSRDGWALHVPTQRWLPVSRPPAGILEGPAVTWAGDRLFLWGGVRWLGDQPVANGAGWTWLPLEGEAG